MLRPNGYGVTFDPDRGVMEHDTAMCNHCNKHLPVKPFCDPTDDLGGHCRICDKFICSACVDENCCVPFMKKIEQQEERYYRWRRTLGV